MKGKLICILILFILSLYSCKISKPINKTTSQKNNQFNFVVEDGIVIGKIPITIIFESENNIKWFKKNYDRYNVKDSLANAVKPNLKDIQIDIYLGTWCGDTKRMFPKFIKILEFLNYDLKSINYYALDKNKKALIEIDTHLSITNVPTIIFYRNGKEINRIVENHVISVEADMLNILTVNNYRNSLSK